jgi:ABC-type phosphate/phosphonate transport system substrate-binding protein
MCAAKSIFGTRHLGMVMMSGLLAMAAAHAGQNDPVLSNKATNVTASYRPQESFQSVATPEKALNKLNTDLVFSAPPRGSYQEEVAIYQPIVDLLSKVIGKKVTYQYSDNWLSYSKDMTEGSYDIVFDGPAFNGWRIDKLSHTPIVRLPEDFVFVVITKADNDRIKQVKDLAGRKICAHAPPNLGTLTLLSQFDNPSRQPLIIETKGWDNSYKAMLDGKCAATVVPIKNLTKNDAGAHKLTKTLYQHKAMPNQAISVGPRITPDLHKKIAQALLSEEGKQATAKLRAAYAGKDFVPTTRDEYAGLGDLLKTSLYYQ